MPYSDPDRDHIIADLRRQLTDAEARYRTTHALWRAGLHLAQQRKDYELETALSGDPDGQS